MAKAPGALSLFLLMALIPALSLSQEEAVIGTTMYRGPQAFQDPRDPFQAVRWTSGLYVPQRLRLEQAPFYTKTIDYDPQADQVSIAYFASEWVIRPGVTYDHEAYARLAFMEELRGSLKETETSYGTQSYQKGLINVRLPFQVPFTEKLFGEGAPNLSVRGSHRINVTGTSKWTVDAPPSQFGKQSIFPSLEMKQDLNVSLKGKIGTKLSLDIQQNSEALTPLENALKIRYTGEEDEVIKRVDLGNTSLSLPKTQNISFSARQEGLFGVRADAKLGDINITAIASRQEGQQAGSSYSGSGETIKKSIRDYGYEARRFFYLFDPSLFTNSTEYPRINYASVEVLLDDNNQPNNEDDGARFATAQLEPDPADPGSDQEPSETGHFHRLLENDDYRLQPLYENDPIYVLQLNTSLSQDQTLALAYQETLATGDVIWRGESFRQNPDRDSLTVKMLSPAWDVWGSEFVTQSEWAPVRNLELKSIYFIGRNINAASLAVSIWRIGTDEYDTQTYNGRQLRFINLLEIDRENNETGDPVEGGDGTIDSFIIDYSRGLLFFPMARPFDYFKLDEATGRSPEIYDREHKQLLQEANKDFHKYEIRVSYEKPLNQISIGGFGGVLENSETVRLNNVVLERGTDYTVDWNSGVIELRETPPPNADIQVTWSEDSLLKQGATSLFGASVYNEGNKNYSWSTSWLHKSEGLPERRPRLGQESSKITLGDLSGSVRFRPWALTDLADALPGVSTSAPSDLSFTGSLGLSFPNPNTRRHVWAADMESAKLVSSTGLSNRNWSYSSIPEDPPYTPEGSSERMPLSLSSEGRGRLVWFSPATVDRGDLRPELDVREAREPQSVLEVVYIPTNQNVGADYKWGGLVTSLSRTGIDLSEAQYLEVWVNDFVPYDRREERRGELRIDFGTVSEDAVWDPLEPPNPPNGILDTEDSDTDGVVSTLEDLGLDGLKNKEEEARPDPNSTGGDPAFDDYEGISNDSERVKVEDSLKRKLAKMNRLNGTEGNTSLDTEDLDRDGTLDGSDNYYGFTISLSDSAYIDVTRDSENLEDLARPDLNGWRAYRVPITDKNRQIAGSPLLNNVEHMRVWFRGIDKDNGGTPDTLDVQIASLSVVSNRWERQPILLAGKEVREDELKLEGATYSVAVVNNKDDEQEYDAPFSLERRNRVTEREQSLSLEYEEFQPGHEFRATRFYPKAENFTLYQDVRFYLNPRLQAPGDSLEFFVRFSSSTGKDSLDYYELATTVTYEDPRVNAKGWVEFKVPVTDLSALKTEQPAFSDSFVVGPDHRPSMGNGLVATIRGTPSFSQVRIMSVGLRNRGENILSNGRVWVDDIRMGDVRKDMGWTGNLSMSLRMADLLSFSARIRRQSEDFLRLNQNRGSGFATEGIGFDTSFEAHKFVEDTGLRLPIKYSYNKSHRVPKFRANSDVEFTGENSGRDIEEDTKWNLGMNISRQTRGRRSWLGKNTIDAVKINTNYSGNTSNNKTGIDSTSSNNTSVTYTMVPPSRSVKLGRLRVFPMPKQINVSWSRSFSRRIAYTKDRFDPSLVTLTNDIATRKKNMALSTNFNPVRSLTLSASSRRDLMDDNWLQPLLIEERPATRFFGINLGREVSRDYKLNYSLNPKLTWVNPRISLSGGYNQATGPRETGQGYDHVAKAISNNRSIRVNMSLPLKRFLDSLRPKKVAGTTTDTKNKAKAEAIRRAEEERKRVQLIAENRAKEKAFEQGEASPDTATAENVPGSGKESGKEEVSKPKKKGFFLGPLLRILNPKDIQLQAFTTKNTSFNNIYGGVAPLYQLGLSSDPGGDMRSVNRITEDSGRVSLSRSSESREFILNGNTGVVLFKKLSVEVKFAHTRSRSEANTSNPDVRSNTTWPDLVIRWDRLRNGLPLINKVLKNFKTVNTRYSRKTIKRGTDENPEESISISSQFNPLFSINGTLRGGWQMSTQVSTSRTVTKRPIANSEQINKSLKVTASFKRRFTRGPNKKAIDLDLNAAYSRNPKVSKGFNTQQSGLETLRVGTSARVKITDSIPGTFGMTFTQRKDLRTLRIDRSLGVNFSTRVSF